MIRYGTLFAVVLVVLSALFAGCMNSPYEYESWSVGFVSISMLHQPQIKTVLPTIDPASYVISFQNGPEPADPVTSDQSSCLVTLPPGTWDVIVEAYDDAAPVPQKIAEGSATGIAVSYGTTTEVAISLLPLSSGAGSIDLTVTWPETVAVASADVLVDEAAPAPETVTLEALFVAYAAGAGSGSHTVVFGLYDAGSVLLAHVEEAVQVYDNLCSSAVISLSDSDFTASPADPTDLQASEGLGQIALAWTDNSYVETGYVVERSTGDNSNYIVLDDTLTANTVSYTDLGLTEGTAYFYLVRARNSFGDSGYSNEISLSVAPPTPGGAGVLSCSEVTAESIRIDWGAASDNATLQGSLVYKVVRSDLDNIATVTDAETIGDTRVIVMDWTADTTTAVAGSLDPGTSYYFNVLVQDEAGYKAVYAVCQQATSAGTGELSLTITVTNPQDETITFSEADDVVAGQTHTLAVSISEPFDSYDWRLYGVDLSAQTTSTVSVDCNLLAPGVHHLAVFVERNGLLYSNTLRFRVHN